MKTRKIQESVSVSPGKELLYRQFLSGHEGLSQTEAQKRLVQHGKNILFQKKKISGFSIFLEQFKSPLLFVLISAMVLTGILGHWIDFSVVGLAVLVNVFLGFYQEYHSEQIIDALTNYIKQTARVLRDGVEKNIEASELVIGDIVLLSYGSRVPADARLIDEQGLRVDESILTGESNPVEKDVSEISFVDQKTLAEQSNKVFAGTLVVEGTARAIVTHTGTNTELGKIASLVIETKSEMTPLQKTLSHLAWIIFWVVIVIVSGIFVFGVIQGESVMSMLQLSIAIAVGTVPESLPIALTVILAVGAQRIAQKQGVIRKLSAAETLGSTTVILSDKTGTLTQANMKIVEVVSLSGFMTGSHQIKNSSSDEIELDQEQKKILSYAVNCIDVGVSYKNNSIEVLGKSMEVSIFYLAQKLGLQLDHVIKKQNSALIPFNSTNKFSVWKSDTKVTVLGAPDILIKRSSLSEEQKKKVFAEIHALSLQGARILGVATFSPIKQKKILSKKNVYPEDVIGITVQGFIIFKDPLRSDVVESIKEIEAMGTRVIMVTGDLPGTARAIASELGWSISDDHVMTGETLSAIPDEILIDKLSSIKIFARVTPEDKLRIGRLFQKKGEVVAMTGDGVNDAPSLKAMDIGIALGSGTDVAKGAADIVLLQDSFTTIVTAIKEGRRIIANIRKVFVYLMSNAFDQIALILGSLIFGFPLPLTALQIIWVNLFTGSLPALSYAFDDDYDGRDTHAKQLKNLLNTEVKVLAVGVGILSSVILFIFYTYLIKTGMEINLARSILFICFASYVLFVSYPLRSLRKQIWQYPIFANKKLNASILVALALLSATIFVPFLRNLFTLVPIPMSYWWIIIVWIIFNIGLVELVKFFFKDWELK